MPKTSNLKQTVGKLKKLKKAIKKSVLTNIDKIIEENCKVIVERSKDNNSREKTNIGPNKNDEIKKLRKKWKSLGMTFQTRCLTSRRKITRQIKL